MLGLYAQPDVLVAGAGVTGVIAAITASRQGARVLLIDAGSTVGGMLTGGRLTKAAGFVPGGLYREILQRVTAAGGGDDGTQRAHWGRYSGVWDPECMQRVLLDLLRESGVRMLLHARVVDAIVERDRVAGVEVLVKGGRRLILARTVIDASGDADVATLAGAATQLGREGDQRMQPMSAYLRVLQVDMPAMIGYVRSHRDDFVLANIPDPLPADPAGYAFNVVVAGFGALIARARAEGFDWFLPRERLLVKSGLMPGEVNLNVTRVHGNALDEDDLTHAELEVRRQAYCVHDFLRRYVPGFGDSVLFDVAPRLGVRESRRVVGDYVLSAADVRGQARFADAIGLSECPIDIHDPDSAAIHVESVGAGYGIPFRCLLPRGLDGMLVAGRCASADHVAASSLRNTPACAMMGEAAGVAAALAARAGVGVRGIPVSQVQARLSEAGVPLGCDGAGGT